MATNPQFRPVEPLPALWREWTRLVGQFAGRDGAGVRVTTAGYGALYARITGLCEGQAAVPSPASEFYRHLAEVVRPWVTLHAMRQADAELLSELHSRAVALDRELHGGRAGASELPRWAVRLTVCVLAALSLFGIGWWGGLFGHSGEQAAEWVRAIRLWVMGRSLTDWVWASAVLLVLIACVLAVRPRRS